MNLPSFLWLWKTAAWAMGLSLVAYLLLAITGFYIFQSRQHRHSAFRRLVEAHFLIGGAMLGMVLLLLAIGIAGTLGHYGTLGHSEHLAAGLTAVGLVSLSAWSALQISPQRPWARALHLSANAALFFGFAWVSWTGWLVVQKYLP
ncbi:MAG: DUF4079 domain-containing protein [Oscillatoria sp. Prado101]|nr:DUF4079 domain-containing protein [Oscillatoria sp. Prado101]